jgi:hypothetical protein
MVTSGLQWQIPAEAWHLRYALSQKDVLSLLLKCEPFHTPLVASYSAQNPTQHC